MKLFAPISVQIRNFEAENSKILCFAAEELQKYLTRIFSASGKGSALCELEAEFCIRKNSTLKFDGYKLSSKDGVLRIESQKERGILYGVYEFLRMLGCRFTFPFPELEIVPSLDHFIWDETPIAKNPWLEFRGLALYDATKDTVSSTIAMIDWMTKNNFNLLLTSLHRTDDSGTNANAMFWDEVGEYLLPELRKRGMVIDMSEHSTDCFFSREKYFPAHPEWFSQQEGKRVPGQICYSNAEAVKVFADSFVDFVQKNQDFDIIGLWPLDGGGYCQCEKCADRYTVYNANRYIARRIEEVRPELLVEYLAYKPETWTPPQKSLPKNMTVLVCDLRDKLGYSWGVRAKDGGGAFFFDYMTADNFRYRSNVWINPFYCHEIVNTLIRYHYRGMISLFLPIGNWWQSCINLSYLSQLYYDPAQRVSVWSKDLAEELLGAHNIEKGEKLLNKIFVELQDSGMWGRVPHTLSSYHARVTDRCKNAEQVQRNHLKVVTDEINELITEMEQHTEGAREQIQLQCLREYVRLQWLFFKGVDQYDAEAPDKSAIEEYLSALKEYEKLPWRGFISEKFARFRIYNTGDVLFDE